MPERLTKWGLTAFRLMPRALRWRLVRVGTPNYTVGALVLVRRESRVLLVRQRHTGAWALPGGLLGRGENADEAVRRELREELGLAPDELPLGPPVGVLVDPGPRRIDVLFAVDVDPSTPAVAGSSAEVVETDWFDLDDPPPLTPVTPAIVAKYARVGALPPAGG